MGLSELVVITALNQFCAIDMSKIKLAFGVGYTCLAYSIGTPGRSSAIRSAFNPKPRTSSTPLKKKALSALRSGQIHSTLKSHSQSGSRVTTLAFHIRAKAPVPRQSYERVALSKVRILTYMPCLMGGIT